MQNGKYSITAENRAGKADISHIVQIQIREHRSSVSSLSSIKESPPTPQPEENDEKPDASKAPAGRGQRPPKKDAPPSSGGRRYAPQPPPDPKQQLFFIAFLTDRTIPEGGKTKISCYVEGPDPQARWFKGSAINEKKIAIFKTDFGLFFFSICRRKSFTNESTRSR